MPESRKQGRPAEKPKPETIPDSPENVLRAPDNRPVGDT